MSEALYERLQRLKKQRGDTRSAGTTSDAPARHGEPSEASASPDGRREESSSRARPSDPSASPDGRREESSSPGKCESVRASGGDAPAGDPDSGESDRALRRMGFEPTSDGTWRRIVRRDIGPAAARLRRLERHGGYLTGSGGSLNGRVESVKGSVASLTGSGESSLLFFDAETTGLSAGAGTFAFLVGGATVSDDRSLEVTQLLLPDYPVEPEFLSCVADLLSSDRTLVSYNGKGFDTHVLRARFLMNGVQWTEPPQIDLLYTARKLWKPALPDCKLGTVEHHVLGVERELDLPGGEVPERYFAYLETGAGEVLREVVAHHEQDMVTLALLLDAVEYSLATHTRSGAEPSPERGRFAPEGEWPSAQGKPPQLGVTPDPAGTARMLLPSSPELAVSFLRERCDFDHPFGANRRAMVLLAGLLKRQKRYDEAATVWSALFHTGRSGIAGIELAKHLEHRQKNPSAALAVCDELASLGGTRREALEHRRSRLRRKLR